MVFGSLFSGIGGLDLGLKRAGMSALFHCEFDEYRREVLNERFPGIPNFTDVSEVHYGKPESGSSSGGFFSATQNGRETGPRVSGDIDLLCGGFPCQDLSVAGRRKGLAGARSGLFFEFARIADESIGDGGFILIENVPGLFSSNQGEDFRIVLETLFEFGFNDLSWRTLNSQYFGVPQRRRRVFILGRRSRGTSCGQILLESESSNWYSKTVGKTWEKDSIAALTGLGSGGPDDNDAQNGRLVSGPLTKRYWKGINTTMDDGAAVVAFHHKQDPIHSDEVYPALGTTTEGMGISGEQIGVRRLTPVECERLQGFPDNWTLVNNASNTKRYSAIGDAVTVPVAEWIGRRILKYE